MCVHVFEIKTSSRWLLSEIDFSDSPGTHLIFFLSESEEPVLSRSRISAGTFGQDFISQSSSLGALSLLPW